MADEDYTLLPEKEFLKLKRDVDAIKKNPLMGLGGEDLIASISELTKSVNNLLELFKAAAEEIKLEQRESETIAQKIDPLFSKIDEIVEQNKKLAKGIVAIADMLSEMKTAKPEIKPAAVPPMPAPKVAPPTMFPTRPTPAMPSTPTIPSTPKPSLPPIPPSSPTMPRPLPPPPFPSPPGSSAIAPAQKKKWFF